MQTSDNEEGQIAQQASSPQSSSAPSNSKTQNKTKKIKKQPAKQKQIISSTYRTKKCDFYMKGSCNKGDLCEFSHNFPVEKSRKICKFYLSNACSKGQGCFFSHRLYEYPCKFYHLEKKCQFGTGCRFSHHPIPPNEVQEYLEDNKDFLLDLFKTGKLYDQYLQEFVWKHIRENPALHEQYKGTSFATQANSWGLAGLTNPVSGLSASQNYFPGDLSAPYIACFTPAISCIPNPIPPIPIYAIHPGVIPYYPPSLAPQQVGYYPPVSTSYSSQRSLPSQPHPHEQYGPSKDLNPLENQKNQSQPKQEKQPKHPDSKDPRSAKREVDISTPATHTREEDKIKVSPTKLVEPAVDMLKTQDVTPLKPSSVHPVFRYTLSRQSLDSIASPGPAGKTSDPLIPCLKRFLLSNR